MRINLPLKKDYKNNNAYLDAVYKANQTLIDDAYTGIQNKQMAFKQQILSRMEQGGGSIKNVIKKELHRDVYIPASEKFKENLVSGLKEYKEFKKFQLQLKDERGRFVKFDSKNLNYIGNNQYSYKDEFGNSLVVDFSNSPKQIKIYNLKGK